MNTSTELKDRMIYPFLNIFLFLLLLFNDLALIDIELVRVLQKLVNVIRQAPQVLLKHRPFYFYK